MGDIFSAIRDDEDYYRELCERYGEDSQGDPYGKHADALRKQAGEEYRIKQEAQSAAKEAIGKKSEMGAVKPITSEEAKAQKVTALPDGVIKAWNDLIVASLQQGYATILQTDAADAIATKMRCEQSEVFANHWLDIEDVYRKAGWEVEYDKPGLQRVL